VDCIAPQFSGDPRVFLVSSYVREWRNGACD
jgi:hypothetical protein